LYINLLTAKLQVIIVPRNTKQGSHHGNLCLKKIAALLDRGEIRDGFDIEFLLRKGINLPELKAKQLTRLKERVEGFKEKDFKVTLGSVLESDIRKYYIENKFHYLLEKIAL
jgi:hypothetical protein